MSKVIKILTKEIANCTDCPWMSPCPKDPGTLESEIALICGHPDSCYSRSFAWKDREIGLEPIPAWCPLENKDG